MIKKEVKIEPELPLEFEFNKHENLTEKIPKKNKKCQLCDANFDRHDYLKRHMASFHGKKSYYCNKCDASFAERSGRNRHIASVHEGKKEFKCDTCNASFARKDHLKGD